jgi:signal transduction histidine kinase
MIGNIAHQWRQPLSVISSISTGILAQVECGILDLSQENNYKDFKKNMENIYQTTQYLSKTIDDFRDLVKGDLILETFKIKNILENILNIEKLAFQNLDIELIQQIDKDITLTSYKNPIMQSLINILNNAKDILKNKSLDIKLILINIKTKQDQVHITIQDNGGGIPDDIIHKVFEPYFTTKHKSQGTGLGLSMVYNMITNTLNGKVSVINSSFYYHGKKYYGAKFHIIIPLKL